MSGRANNSAFWVPFPEVKFYFNQCNLRDAVKRLLKFLHTVGAIGLMGSMACFLVIISFAPHPTSLAGYALMCGAMAQIGTWIFFPSLALTLIAGLLAIAANPAFHNAGWAWAKLASGILIFEGGLSAVLGPIQEDAKRSAQALAGQLDTAIVPGSYGAHLSTLSVLLAVTAANVAFGIWRPRLIRLPD